MDEGDSNHRFDARRAIVRELAAGILTSIVALTLYGALTPATIRTGSVDAVPFSQATDSSSVTLPMLVVLLGSMYLSTLFWNVIIEHRRPWPFGPLGPFPNPFWRESITAALAAGIIWTIAGNVWEATRLYVLDDDRFVWVASPAGFAAKWVATVAVFGAAFLLASAIAGRTARERTTLPEPVLGR